MNQANTIVCPECQSRSEVADHEIGKFVQCPVCKKLIKAVCEKSPSNATSEPSEISRLKSKVKKLESKLVKSQKDSSSDVWAKKAEKMHQQNLSYQKEVVRLKKIINEKESTIQDHVTSIEGLETLALRIDSGQKIIYANTPLCVQFKINKESIIGKDYSILRRVMDEHLYNAIKWPSKGDVASKTVTDNKGKHFEVKVTSTMDGIDVIFQDVTNEQRFKKYVQRYVSMDLTKLSEEDLVTFKYPERRFMTVSFTDLRDFTALSETMKPEEVRSTMNAYLEDIIHAIDSNEATVDKIVGDEVMALFGAPRYYEDHALRAIKTACDQMTNLKALQSSFARFGKHMPDCGIGINSGEMVVGNMGCTARQDYTVLGSSVNLAARLCGAARRGEIILTESTLNSALSNLPSGWEYVESSQKNDHDDYEIRGKTEGIQTLPERLKDKVIHIGPNIKSDPDKWEYQFTFLFSIKVKGVKTPLPIISVINKSKRSSLKLDSTKIAKTKNDKFFGKYRLIEKVGRGGMGEVWKAKDNFGNIVALKMLIAGDGASNKQLKRFKREAEIMSKLQHRNICRIYEVGMIEKKSYIAMEYIEGITLSQVLKYQGNLVSNRQSHQRNDSIIQTIMNELDLEKQVKKTRKTKVDKEKERRYFILPIQKTLSLIIKCLDAIEYAHAHGILHRDIKPANIMIRPNGDPVLMDFGLAKMDTDTSEGMSLSLSGQIVGTIEYMAPEQAKSSKMANEISDVYSMGAVFYQMLAGRRHFNSSGNILTDSNALQHHVPNKIQRYNRKVDRALETIALKSLRSEPEERYQSVELFMTDLVRYQSGLDIAAKNVSMVHVFYRLLQRNRLATILTLCFIALFIVGFVASLTKLYLKSEQLNFANDDISSMKDEKSTLQNKIKALNSKIEKQLSEKEASEKARFEALTQANEAKKNKASIENEKELIEQALKNSKGTVDSLKQALAKKEKMIKAESHLKSARNYIHSYSFRNAENEIDQSLAYNPLDPQAILNKTFLLMQRHNYSEALRLLKQNTKNIDRNKTIARLKQLLNNVSKDEELKTGVLKYARSAPSETPKQIGQFKLDLTQTLMDLEAIFFINPKYVAPSKQIDLWKLRLKKSIGPNARLSYQKDKGYSLNLDHIKAPNLGCLKGLKLYQLSGNQLETEHLYSLEPSLLKQVDLPGAKLDDWSWLSKLQLERLNLQQSNIQTLNFLSKDNTPKKLNLANTDIKDLKPLHAMMVNHLDLSGIKSINFEEFKTVKMPVLRKLNLANTSITNLDSLLHFTSLRHLDLSHCRQISELKFIHQMKLDTLRLFDSSAKAPSQLGNIKVIK